MVKKFGPELRPTNLNQTQLEQLKSWQETAHFMNVRDGCIRVASTKATCENRNVSLETFICAATSYVHIWLLMPFVCIRALCLERVYLYEK